MGLKRKALKSIVGLKRQVAVLRGRRLSEITKTRLRARQKNDPKNPYETAVIGILHSGGTRTRYATNNGFSEATYQKGGRKTFREFNRRGWLSEETRLSRPAKATRQHSVRRTFEKGRLKKTVRE